MSQEAEMHVVECAACGNEFEAKRANAKFCKPACRKRGSRREQSAAEGAEMPAEFLAMTRQKVVGLGKLETVEGQQVLVIAERMISPFSTGSEVATLSKEHSRLMGVLSRGARAADPVQAAKDEVARKRAQRQAAR